MKRFSFFMTLALGLFSASLFLPSCQKETAHEAIQGIEDGLAASNRAAFSYGVTVYNGVNPCPIVEMDNATGNVTTVTPQSSYVDNSGTTFNLDNLKGICLTSWGQYFLTTGSPANPGLPANSPYNNALFKVNPTTGQCSYASTAPANIGTVSDLEFDEISLRIKNLLKENEIGLSDLIVRMRPATEENTLKVVEWMVDNEQIFYRDGEILTVNQ